MRSKPFNTVLCIFSLCLVALLIYSAYSEKFRIQSGNLSGGRGVSPAQHVSVQQVPRPTPPPRVRPSDSVSPIPPTPSPLPRRTFIDRRALEHAYPLWRRRFWRHNPHWNRFFLPDNVYWNNTYYPYTSFLDCDNNCCDRGVCYETGGLCEWTALGNVYTGTPEQCVRQKECIARNISDGNANLETLCKID